MTNQDRWDYETPRHMGLPYGFAVYSVSLDVSRHSMPLLDIVLGRLLASFEESAKQIGPRKGHSDFWTGCTWGCGLRSGSRRWFYWLLYTQRATILKTPLLMEGHDRVSVLNIPWDLKS